MTTSHTVYDSSATLLQRTATVQCCQRMGGKLLFYKGATMQQQVQHCIRLHAVLVRMFYGKMWVWQCSTWYTCYCNVADRIRNSLMSVVFRYVNGVYTNIEDVTFPEDLPKIISLTELRNILGIECFHDKDTGVNSFLVRKLTELGYHQYNGRNPKDGTKGRFYYKR